jgi:hypothetical protein
MHANIRYTLIYHTYLQQKTGEIVRLEGKLNDETKKLKSKYQEFQTLVHSVEVHTTRHVCLFKCMYIYTSYMYIFLHIFKHKFAST